MTVTQVVEIGKEDYEKYVDANPEDLMQFASDKAIEVNYHPAGYDCRNPKVFEKDGKYKLSWERNASCD